MKDHKNILFAGCVVATLTIALLCRGPGREIYTTVSVQTTDDGTRIASIGEADGYLGGRWNLWEFIGDSINRMLSGE